MSLFGLGFSFDLCHQFMDYFISINPITLLHRNLYQQQMCLRIKMFLSDVDSYDLNLAIHSSVWNEHTNTVPFFSYIFFLKWVLSWY